MKNTWVLSIKTSLPEVCEKRGDLKTSIYTFDSFEEARAALRQALKKYAFSKNSMFDGEGNMIYFKEYVDDFYQFDDDEDYVDSYLTPRKLKHIYETVEKIFNGEDTCLEFCGECDNDLIVCACEKDVLDIYGDYDGPINGYNPVLKTNMLSMEVPQNYYLYIDDAFGQDEVTTELYIDLIKPEHFDENQL